MDFANVSCIGNLVRDPRSGLAANGKAWASFSIAVNSPRPVDGSTQRPATFFNCIAWELAAEAITDEVAGKLYRQGTKVIIVGTLRSSTRPDGVTPYTELVVDRIAPDALWLRNNITKIYGLSSSTKDNAW